MGDEVGAITGTRGPINIIFVDKEPPHYGLKVMKHGILAKCSSCREKGWRNTPFQIFKWGLRAKVTGSPTSGVLKEIPIFKASLRSVLEKSGFLFLYWRPAASPTKNEASKSEYLASAEPWIILDCFLTYFDTLRVENFFQFPPHS